jgi:hypothetical protein
MSSDGSPNEPRAAPPGDCPLSAGEQTRNLVLYGINVTLVYLAAPVLYVGLVHAALLERLGASRTLANLPTSMYFWMTPLPLLVAWYFCQVRVLKAVLVVTYCATAATCALVVAALLLPPPGRGDQALWVTVAVLAQGAVLGWTLGVVANFQWEILGRGVAEQRRGFALGLAFGVGPIIAFLASLGSQWLLRGLAYPWNFAVLFGTGVPAMLLGAVLSTLFVVPPPAREVPRQPFVAGVLGGLGEFFRYRLTLLGAVATFLVASGYNILNNFTLYTQEAVGTLAEEYAGYQNALRFGFKAVAGLFLGWLLTRTNPKAGLLVTGFLCLASVAWILMAPGLWFLLSFGLMGAGELWGVYYPNYILSSSAKSRMRRNMAIVSLIYMPTGFATLLFGVIGDRYGLRASFLVSLGVLTATLVFVQIMLPARPRPPYPDRDALELAPETAPAEPVSPALATDAIQRQETEFRKG